MPRTKRPNMHRTTNVAERKFRFLRVGFVYSQGRGGGGGGGGIGGGGGGVVRPPRVAPSNAWQKFFLRSTNCNIKNTQEILNY